MRGPVLGGATKMPPGLAAKMGAVRLSIFSPYSLSGSVWVAPAFSFACFLGLHLLF